LRTAGAPVTLASSQVDPLFIAVDATSVYWVNDGLNGCCRDRQRHPDGGGTVVKLTPK
jgi:hypothetical protein